MKVARWPLVAFVLAALAGCGRGPAPANGTGAREAAAEFCQALLQKDWPRAYRALHPDSAGRFAEGHFSILATRYVNDMGLAPEEMAVRSCDEQGAKAVAHVHFRGHADSKLRFYKETVVLRKGAQGWGVVLPSQFGRAKQRGRGASG
jgi:hypothetical protein